MIDVLRVVYKRNTALNMIHIIYTLVRNGLGQHFALNHDIILPFLTTTSCLHLCSLFWQIFKCEILERPASSRVGGCTELCQGGKPSCNEEAIKRKRLRLGISNEPCLDSVAEGRRNRSMSSRFALLQRTGFCMHCVHFCCQKRDFPSEFLPVSSGHSVLGSRTLPPAGIAHQQDCYWSWIILQQL